MKLFLLAFAFSLLTLSWAQSKDVSIVVKGYELNGTLEVPKSKNPVDAVLIIAGSGPTDRNGNTAILPGKNNSLEMPFL